MIKKITYFLIFISLFNSCRKYDFDTSTIENKEWFLVSGKVYLENLTTGELTYYEHFDDNQSSSNLDVFGGSNIDFDKIHKYKTKWYFSDGLFTLNDSTTYQYTTQGSGVKKQYNIIGILPYGSSRNLGILYFDDNRMDVVVYEANESHLGDNYHYYTVLTFVTNNSSCNLCNYSNTTGYQYGGTITIRDISEPTCCDSFANKMMTGGPVILYVYEQLLAFDWERGPAGTGEFTNNAVASPEAQMYGELVERVEKPDPETWILTIRQGVHYQDTGTEAGNLVGGREMTAEDVAWAYERNVHSPDGAIQVLQPRVAAAFEIEQTGPWEVPSRQMYSR